MVYRTATIPDIKQIQKVRNSVVENTLSNPALVTDADCEDYMTNRGKGWVCEAGETIVAFAIADLVGNNIWALFVHPAYEARGIGKKLHQLMLDWYFLQTNETVWLGTAFNTRAETFYRQQGWQQVGMHGPNEIKFEMTIDAWTALNSQP